MLDYLLLSSLEVIPESDSGRCNLDKGV